MDKGQVFFPRLIEVRAAAAAAPRVPARADSPAGSLMFTVKLCLQGQEPPTEAAG